MILDMAVTPAGVSRMLAYFRWCRYAQPPATRLASFGLHKRSMNKNLLAFFLASLTTSTLLSTITLIHPASTYQRPVQVIVRSDNDVHDIVTVVESLHRQDVDVQTMRSFEANRSPFTIIFIALGFMFLIGLTLFFYKLFCRWLGVAPTI
jgi:hypothetical protein